MYRQEPLIILGYSGHAYVILDSAQKAGWKIKGYCESELKNQNPFDIEYMGPESPKILQENPWFVAIGNNNTRATILSLYNTENLITIVHPESIIGHGVTINKGSFIGPGAIVNASCFIGTGCIINSGSIIEHEARIEDFSHIAPGAVLAGNVHIGKRSFIGANATIKEGTIIGNDVTIGAGSVVLTDIPDGATYVGNPARKI